jgi:hypothetical protein
MKIYYLDEKIRPGMSIDIINAITDGVEEKYIDEFIENYFCISIIKTDKPDKLQKQIELIELIKEQYFIEEEIDEDEDTWEYDQMEREREYRLMQGF